MMLIDIKSMIALYDTTWKWNVESSAEGLSTLIQSFYQFSREVDEGGEAFPITLHYY